MSDIAISQLRRGVLEFCVLALLRDGERYGFEIVRTLSQADGLHPLAAGYLDDLRHAGRRLPRSAMRDLLVTLILPGRLGHGSVRRCVGLSPNGEPCTSTNGSLAYCTGGPSTATEVLGIAVLVIVLLAPIVPSVYLARRARP